MQVPIQWNMVGKKGKNRISNLLEVRNKRTRHVVSIFLMLIAAIHYTYLYTTGYLNPSTDMFGVLVVLFSCLLVFALAAVNFLPRLNWFILVASVALPILPFFVVLEPICGLHGLFLVSALFLIPLILVTMIIGIVVWLYR